MSATGRLRFHKVVGLTSYVSNDTFVVITRLECIDIHLPLLFDFWGISFTFLLNLIDFLLS